jgi:hypothetical protein
MMKWLVDKIISWQNDYFMKWAAKMTNWPSDEYVGEMNTWWNDSLMKLPIHEIIIWTNWWNGVLVDEITI